MKKIVIIALVVVTAIGAGVHFGRKAARHKLTAALSGSGVKNGPWNCFSFGENLKAAEFLLATQCISGGASGQTLYFIANSDSKGAALTAGNNYKIEGADLLCGSWSIAVYADDRLARSEGSAGFLTKSMARRMTDNTWEACIAPAGSPGGECIQYDSGDDDLSIVLRIYNPAPDLLENIGAIELPTIYKI